MQSHRSKRRIEVNSVSLVDLKAEIARRQVEVKSKISILPEGCSVIRQSSSSTGSSKPLLKQPIEPKVISVITPDVDPENDQNNAQKLQLERVRKKLEAKAKVYEAMRQAAMVGRRIGNADDEEHSPLVDFERKAMEAPNSADLDWVDSSDEEGISNDECRRKEKRPNYDDPVSIPDGPVTYAHLRKGEVRDHGTGFYAFSAEAEQRAVEMASLREMHKQAEEARARAEQARAKRDIQMGQRLARLRARKGLPDVAAAVAQCLGDDQIKTSSTQLEETGQSSTAPGSVDICLGSDDLDIASMLRRLRDEAEQHQQQQQQQQQQSSTPSLPSATPFSAILGPRKPPREWDRGKSMVSARAFIEREHRKRDLLFAPPSNFY